MATYFISLIILLVLQMVLITLLSGLGLSSIYIEIIVDLILSFAFSFLNYQGDKKEAFKDPKFHRDVAFYFSIFMILYAIFLFI